MPSPRARALLVVAILLAALLAWTATRDDAGAPPAADVSAAPAAQRRPRAPAADTPAGETADAGRVRGTPVITRRTGSDGAWDGRVAVTVVADDDGRPVADAAVRILRRFKASEFREARTDGSGRAELPWWTGRANAWVRARGFVARMIELKEEDDAPEGLDGPPRPATVATRKFRLTRGRPLAGRVVLGEFDAPVAGAEVYVWDDATRGIVECAPDGYDANRDSPLATDADGRFKVAGLPPAHGVTIAARAPGFAPVVVRVAATDLDDEVLLRLSGGGVVLGTVFDGDAPAAACAVCAVPQGDRASIGAPEARGLTAPGRPELAAFATTDAAGRYRIEGLPTPGAFVVVANAKDGARAASEPASLDADGATASRDLRLGRACDIHGKGFAPDGTKVEVEYPSLRRIDGGPDDDPLFSGGGSTGGNEFAAWHRPPGRYEMIVTAKGPWRAARVVIEVVAGETEKQVEVRFEPGLALAGKVVDEAGAPVAGVYVGFAGGTAFVSKATDAEGEFRLEGLDDVEGTVVLDDVNGRFLGAEVAGVRPGAAPLVLTARRVPGIVGRLSAVDGRRDVLCRVRTTEREWMGRAALDERGAFRVPFVPEKGPFDLVVFPEKGAAPAACRFLVVLSDASIDLGVIDVGAGGVAEGVVTDAAGAPVRGAEVSVVEFWADDARVETDVAGRFRIDALPAGPAHVAVRADGFAAAFADVEPGRAAAVRLDRGVEATGRLVDADGVPVAGRHVRFLPLDANGFVDRARASDAATDSIGRFSLRLAPGIYQTEEAKFLPRYGQSDHVRDLPGPGANTGRVRVEARFKLPLELRLPPR